MSKIKKSDKRVQIDKANVKIVLIVSVAAVVTALSIVGSKSLIDMFGYNTRVIKEQKTALKVSHDKIKNLRDSEK